MVSASNLITAAMEWRDRKDPDIPWLPAMAVMVGNPIENYGWLEFREGAKVPMSLDEENKILRARVAELESELAKPDVELSPPLTIEWNRVIQKGMEYRFQSSAWGEVPAAWIGLPFSEFSSNYEFRKAAFRKAALTPSC